MPEFVTKRLVMDKNKLHTMHQLAHSIQLMLARYDETEEEHYLSTVKSDCKSLEAMIKVDNV